MSIITGKIEKIEDGTTSSEHQKKIVTINSEDNQKSFIEFRGPIMIGLLDEFQENDTVIIPIKYDGKVSKGSGMRYNNLVAASIKLVAKSK